MSFLGIKQKKKEQALIEKTQKKMGTRAFSKRGLGEERQLTAEEKAKEKIKKERAQRRSRRASSLLFQRKLKRYRVVERVTTASKWLVLASVSLLGIGLIAKAALVVYEMHEESLSKTEKVAKWIKHEGKGKVFCEPAENRKFWEKMEPKPALLPVPTIPEMVSDKNTSPMLWVMRGTAQEAFYNTGKWIPIVEYNIGEILKGPWRDTSLFSNEFVDLYTTDTAANLAFAITILNKKLDPKIVEKTKTAIRAKVIDPYLQDLENYKQRRLAWGKDMCPWLESKNNWNAVCIANIIYATLAIEGDAEKKAEIIVGSENALEDYFKTFEKDGYLSSGIRYWDYGFSHLVLLAERLLLATDGKINLYKNPAVKGAVSFPLQWEIKCKLPAAQEKAGEAYYPLFADNKNPINKHEWVWWALSRRYNLPLKIEKGIPWNSELAVTDFMLNPTAVKFNGGNVEAPNPTRTYYESSGALISRNKKDDITIVSKAGTNHEEHNHNQIGAFTVFDKSKAILGSLGAIKYTPDTVGAKRYLFNLLNSNGNPVPVVDGQLQNNLRKSHGVVLNKTFTDDVDSITYDIKDAYNVDGLTKLERRVEIDKRKKTIITITDSFEADRDITFDTAIITTLNPIVADNKIILKDFSNSYEVSAKSPLPLISTLEKFNDCVGETEKYKRIGFSIKTPAKSGRITYTITKK